MLAIDEEINTLQEIVARLKNLLKIVENWECLEKRILPHKSDILSNIFAKLTHNFEILRMYTEYISYGGIKPPSTEDIESNREVINRVLNNYSILSLSYKDMVRILEERIKIGILNVEESITRFSDRVETSNLFKIIIIRKYRKYIRCMPIIIDSIEREIKTVVLRAKKNGGGSKYEVL